MTAVPRWCSPLQGGKDFSFPPGDALGGGTVYECFVLQEVTCSQLVVWILFFKISKILIVFLKKLLLQKQYILLTGKKMKKTREI